MPLSPVASETPSASDATRTRPKILIVGMQSSSHVARWIDLVADQNWDLHVFPVNGSEPNFDLRGVTLHWPRGPRRAAPAETNEAAEPPVRTSAVAKIARLGAIALRNPTHTVRRLRDRLLSFGPAATGQPRRGRLNFRYFSPSEAELGGPGTIATGTVRLGESDASAPVLNGPGVLASVIRAVRPDLIHSMEFQHAGYLVLRTRETFGAGFPKWLATNWGSDIYWFGRDADHAAQIRRLLAAVDAYSCECRRDVEIARRHGYSGPVMPTLPSSGGFDLAQIAALRSPLPPSRRRLIMVKGYQHFAGRALTALQVLERFARELAGYRVVLYSATAEPRRRASELAQRGVLNIETIDWTPHHTILSYFGKARLYLGISLSDAISTSVLEAMAMGAFPVQTNTSCCEEWFTDGVGGFAVPPDDFDTICERFHRALTDDALVDRASTVNAETVRTRLDNAGLAPRMVAFYEEALSRPKRHADVGAKPGR